MITLTNQTAYRCEGCGKRYFTKHGAKKHEAEYCRKHPDSKANPKNCPHDEVVTSWSPIPGEEFRSEPDYDYCVKCGERF